MVYALASRNTNLKRKFYITRRGGRKEGCSDLQEIFVKKLPCYRPVCIK